ncbi:MAG: UDP-N-acetylglucosamine 2-epimerase (non-hydrolyzing) [Hyphomicrobiaceae bacterium]|nr:UDP-N-acetylglucosamine 2-epimerase (non-hydrolyzing) [Hyphomicrobiaceae bacterium]
MRVIAVIGTRPEAVKMAPVITALRARSSAGIESLVLSTGQHHELLHPILDVFGIRPDVELSLMRKCHSLNELYSAAVAEIDRVFCELQPDVVLVHGDTTSAAAAAMAAFHRRVSVGHVEAGLRSGDLGQPWPEEMNRRLIDLGAEFHFAPTRAAKARLIGEGVAPASILVTGNTVIDALLSVAARIDCDARMRAALDDKFSFLDGARELVLVTGHRRENFGDGIRDICRALLELSERRGLAIVYPVHLNPNVRKPVIELLGGCRNIHLIPPAGYLEFVYLMMRSSLILTDSGGVQEEAPSLGKPVLVMRNVTERPEAVAAGLARLVGTEPQRIVTAACAALDDPGCTGSQRSRASPFGDGFAAQRIADFLAGRRQRAPGADRQRDRYGELARGPVGSPAPDFNRLPSGSGLEVLA